MVQAFPAYGPDPAFGERVRPWRLDRRAHYFDARRSHDGVEGGGELCVPVAKEEAELASPLLQVEHEVACHLGGPGAVGVGRHAKDVHVKGPKTRRPIFTWVDALGQILLAGAVVPLRLVRRCPTSVPVHRRRAREGRGRSSSSVSGPRCQVHDRADRVFAVVGAAVVRTPARPRCSSSAPGGARAFFPHHRPQEPSPATAVEHGHPGGVGLADRIPVGVATSQVLAYHQVMSIVIHFTYEEPPARPRTRRKGTTSGGHEG